MKGIAYWFASVSMADGHARRQTFHLVLCPWCYGTMTRVFKHTWSLRKRFFYKCMECDAVAYEPDLRENLRIPFQCLWGASES